MGSTNPPKKNLSTRNMIILVVAGAIAAAIGGIIRIMLEERLGNWPSTLILPVVVGLVVLVVSLALQRRSR